MKLGKPSSLLVDSGGGWFDSPAPVAGVFRKPRFTLRFSEKKPRLLSGSGETELDEEPLEFLERRVSEGCAAVGYISYDYLEHTTPGAKTSGREGKPLPLLFFHFYGEEDFRTVAFGELETPPRGPGTGGKRAPPRANVSRDAYAEKISAVKERIAAGDVYQVNLSRKFRFDSVPDPLSWFLDFYRAQPVPFAAFVDFSDFQILSGSMELFLRKKGDAVTTRPVKGTAPRDADPGRDAELARGLGESPKERAENLMIVDLMRNDLGRICRYGSVTAGELFRVRAYSTLFQMESEVGGLLRPGVGLAETVASTFPPGSVTGAPKREALRMIDGLEPHARGPYCGAVCLFLPGGDFAMSVAIRTGVNSPDGADFWFGGGIVWDSEAEKEYMETELKAKAVTSVE